MLMSEACLDSWQPYGCEWSVSYLWHSMGWVRRADLIVLALMLAYVVVVFVRVSYHCRAARREIDSDGRDLRKLVAELSIQMGNLKSIASTAPYLGLAGTSIGIIDGFRGVGFVAESALAAVILTGLVPVALTTTIAGLVVAIPATWSYNYLRARIDSLESAIPGDKSRRRVRNFGFAQKLPLAALCSIIPFPLVAAPTLAILAGVVFMEYSSYRTPTGLGVQLAPARCEFDGDDRLIVLRVSNAGEVFINSEKEDWTSLAGRLSQIYSGRKYRTLYLVAENDVSFQTVADAIDIANSLSLNVRLITPAAMKATCLEPVAIRPARHGRK